MKEKEKRKKVVVVESVDEVGQQRKYAKIGEGGGGEWQAHTVARTASGVWPGGNKRLKKKSN